MIAVTGANGLLGSFILRRLIKENIPVIGIKKPASEIPEDSDLKNITWREADVLDREALIEAFNGATTIIHTAALVSFNPYLRKSIFDINETGTRNVVNVCLEQNINELIHISSVAAIGRQKDVSNINENTKWIESDLNTDYAISKYRAELEAWRGQEEGLQVAVINPSIILAPPTGNKSSSQIFHRVLSEKKIYTEAQTNYVDVRDVVELIWQIYSRKIYGERFIANAGSTSFSNLLNQIADRLNKKRPSIRVPKNLLPAIAFFSNVISRIKKTDPLITSQTIRIAKQNFYYSNEKAINKLGIQFKSLEDTLDWCCQSFSGGYTTNKQNMQH